MKPKQRLSIFVASVLLGILLPAIVHADNVVLLYPFLQANELYSDNIALASSHAEGDFDANFSAGFYLDYTGSNRHTTLEYSTYATLFASHSELDRAGQAQFVRFTDQENISPNTRLVINNWFLRDSPLSMAVITNDQPISFNPVFAAFFLANDHSIVNVFTLQLVHSFNRNWAGEAEAAQETISSPGGDTGLLQSVSLGLQRRLSETFSVGPGYKFYDLEFTLPSDPNSEAHWPVADAIWMPIKNMRAEGYVGPIVSYNTSGLNRGRVEPGGLLSVRYHFGHVNVGIGGGQEPGLSSGIGAGGINRSGRGDFTWDMTKFLRMDGGAGYYEIMPPGADAKLFSYGVGLSERVSKYLIVYARYIGFRREYSGAPNPVALPSGVVIGQEATGNYYVIGATIAFEALRWSW